MIIQLNYKIKKFVFNEDIYQSQFIVYRKWYFILYTYVYSATEKNLLPYNAQPLIRSMNSMEEQYEDVDYDTDE